MYQFGSGTLVGKPVSGNLAANPTPIVFGALQDVSLDFAFDIKELYGQYQAPLAAARGKMKITGKAKFANIQAKIMNDLFWGLAVTTGMSQVSLDQAVVIPATPFTMTPGPVDATHYLVPNAGVYSQDMGVRYNSTGLPLTKVAAAPATGQYTVNEATGVYTFVVGDQGVTVLLSYLYTVATGFTTTVTNQLMGFQPEFQIILTETFGGKQHNVLANRCIAAKLQHNTKNEDFMIPELDFICLATASGAILSQYDPE